MRDSKLLRGTCSFCIFDFCAGAAYIIIAIVYAHILMNKQVYVDFCVILYFGTD